MPLNTIVLSPGAKGHHREAHTDTVLNPGGLCRKAADGNLDAEPKTKAEAIKGGLVVAKEDANIGSTVDIAYAIGDLVPTYEPLPGDRIQVLVKTGEDIDVGAVLNPEGGGSQLVVEAAGADATYRFEAEEDSDGVLAADTLLAVRVL